MVYPARCVALFCVYCSFNALVFGQDDIPDSRFPARTDPATLFNSPLILAVGGASGFDTESAGFGARTRGMAAISRQATLYTYWIRRTESLFTYKDSVKFTVVGPWTWETDRTKLPNGKWSVDHYMALELPEIEEIPANAVIESALFFVKTISQEPQKLTSWISTVLREKGEKEFPDGSRGRLMLRYDFPFKKPPVKNAAFATPKNKGDGPYIISPLKDTVVRVYIAFIPGNG